MVLELYSKYINNRLIRTDILKHINEQNAIVIILYIKRSLDEIHFKCSYNISMNNGYGFNWCLKFWLCLNVVYKRTLVQVD